MNFGVVDNPLETTLGEPCGLTKTRPWLGSAFLKRGLGKASGIISLRVCWNQYFRGIS